MKKTLIAATVLAGFAGVAQAASSVTLYGTLDGGLQYTHYNEKTEITVFKKADHSVVTDKSEQLSKKITKFAINQDAMTGNSFGLKGTEDFGNGVQAIFDLKGTFSLADGSVEQARLFGDKAIVGLASDQLGTITAGHQGDAVDELLTPNVFDGHFGLGIDYFATFKNPNTQQQILPAIAGNTLSPGLKYVSPEWDGAQLALSWGGDNTTTKQSSHAFLNTSTHNNRTSLALAYTLDQLNVSAGVSWAKNKTVAPDNANAPTSSVTARTSTLNWVFGGNYDAGFMNVFGRIGGIKQKVNDVKVASRLAWSLGISAPVTETGTVAAEYQGAKGKYFMHNALAINTKWNAFKLAYLEALSKQTTVYAYGAYQWVHAKQLQDFPVMNGDQIDPNNVERAGIKTHYTTVGFGLNHRF